MTRPRKQVVDYFPHETNAGTGRTLTIIQNKFGNDGIAFWWYLLELLGKTPGHFYDYNNPNNWEFLLTQTHVNGGLASDILSTLSLLDAIDPELHKYKIVWSQNFVDGVGDVYARRQDLCPQKPVIDSRNPPNEGATGISVNNKPVSVDIYPHSKVKESKVNNNREKAIEIWGDVKTLIKTKISAVNFKTWIQDTEGAGIDDAMFFLNVPSEYKREYLMKNQKSIIEDAVCRVTGSRLVLSCVVEDRQNAEKTGDE